MHTLLDPLLQNTHRRFTLTQYRCHTFISSRSGNPLATSITVTIALILLLISWKRNSQFKQSTHFARKLDRKSRPQWVITDLRPLKPDINHVLSECGLSPDCSTYSEVQCWWWLPGEIPRHQRPSPTWSRVAFGGGLPVSHRTHIDSTAYDDDYRMRDLHSFKASAPVDRDGPPSQWDIRWAAVYLAVPLTQRPREALCAEQGGEVWHLVGVGPFSMRCQL